MCIPHFFHQFLYLFYISGIDVSCGVHALCYLVQIAADFSECGIVFPKFGFVWLAVILIVIVIVILAVLRRKKEEEPEEQK